MEARIVRQSVVAVELIHTKTRKSTFFVNGKRASRKVFNAYVTDPHMRTVELSTIMTKSHVRQFRVLSPGEV